MVVHYPPEEEKLLERLLSAGEYDDFDQSIVIEGDFVECDATKRVIRQVILGISPINMIVVCRYVPSVSENLMRCPALYASLDQEIKAPKNTDWFQRGDDILNNLELSSVIKLDFIKVSFNDREMHVFFGDSVLKIYEICTTSFNGDVREAWNQWKDTVPKYAKTIHYRRSTLGKLLGIGKTEVVVKAPTITPPRASKANTKKVSKSDIKVTPSNTERLRVINEEGELQIESDASRYAIKSSADKTISATRPPSTRRKNRRGQERKKPRITFKDAVRRVIDENRIARGEKPRSLHAAAKEVIRLKKLSILPRFSVSHLQALADAAAKEN